MLSNLKPHNVVRFSGLGHCDLEDNRLAVFKTALPTGIWLMSKHMSMQQVRAE